MKLLRWYRRAIILTILSAPLAAAGCATGARSTASPPSAATAAAYDSLYRARTDSARMRFTKPDVDFINGMIGHHAQALIMTGLTPSRASDNSIRILAARITNAQRDEIALMQQWLRRRGLAVPEVHADTATLMVHGADHAHHDMPGMLTETQLQQLKAARGAAFDRLFLQLMIQHHEGAVEMVRKLFATDGALQDEDVFRLASDVQVDQITEINRMKLMLRELTPDRRN